MPDIDASPAAYDAYVEAQHEPADTRPLPELEREFVALLLERETCRRLAQADTGDRPLRHRQAHRADRPAHR